MKIVCPITASKQVAPLVKHGADSFFCGFLNENLINKSPIHLLWNRRAFLGSNFADLADLKKAINAAHDLGKTLFVTVNELFYSPDQAREIFPILHKLNNVGLDGIIVTDIETLLTVKEEFPDLKIVISSLANVLNSRSARFFGSFGVERIILPTAVTLQESIDIVKSCPELKFECFINSGGCININGLCTYCHWRLYRTKEYQTLMPCQLPTRYSLVRKTKRTDEDKLIGNLANFNKRRLPVCTFCWIWDMLHAGLDSIKLIEREYVAKEFELLLKTVKTVRGLRDTAKDFESAEEFSEYACKKRFELVASFDRDRCEEYLNFTSRKP